MFESRLEYRARRAAVSGPDHQPWLEASLWVCGAIATAVTALWRLISSRASKTELADAIASVVEQTAAIRERGDEQFEQGREHRERLWSKFDALQKDVGATMIGLSGIQGRLEERAELLRRIDKKLNES
jgi:hypothetical protein